MMTTIEVYQKTAELGLSLVADKGNVLTVRPAERCPPVFAETLKAHKWHLLAMLAWPFVMVESKALGGELVFFCEDEATKTALIEAGASMWSIYTKDELRLLIAQNRVAPLSTRELAKIHQLKKTFNARPAKKMTLKRYLEKDIMTRHEETKKSA
jgi:hypothetical protein